MIKTTEELKRDMYNRWKQLNAATSAGHVPYASLAAFEEAMEAYLERLRVEAELSARLHAEIHERVALLEDGYSAQYQRTKDALADNRDCWNEIYRLTKEKTELRGECEETARLRSDLREMTEARESLKFTLDLVRIERDEIQDRLLVIDHAYHIVQTVNDVAGQELRLSRETIKSYRKCVKRLEKRLKVFKNQPATSGQSCEENAPQLMSDTLPGYWECECTAEIPSFVVNCPFCGRGKP